MKYLNDMEHTVRCDTDLGSHKIISPLRSSGCDHIAVQRSYFAIERYFFFSCAQPLQKNPQSTIKYFLKTHYPENFSMSCADKNYHLLQTLVGMRKKAVVLTPSKSFSCAHNFCVVEKIQFILCNSKFHFDPEHTNRQCRFFTIPVALL